MTCRWFPRVESASGSCEVNTPYVPLTRFKSFENPVTPFEAFNNCLIIIIIIMYRSCFLAIAEMNLIRSTWRRASCAPYSSCASLATRQRHATLILQLGDFNLAGWLSGPTDPTDPTGCTGPIHARACTHALFNAFMYSYVHRSFSATITLYLSVALSLSLSLSLSLCMWACKYISMSISFYLSVAQCLSFSRSLIGRGVYYNTQYTTHNTQHTTHTNEIESLYFSKSMS